MCFNFQVEWARIPHASIVFMQSLGMGIVMPLGGNNSGIKVGRGELVWVLVERGSNDARMLPKLLPYNHAKALTEFMGNG